MKHLKTYTLFEKVSNQTKVFEDIDPDNLDYTIIEDMKEILLPFRDINMEVVCDYSSSDEETILFQMMGKKEKAFDLNNYKGDIEHLISFMKEKGWIIINLEIGIINKGQDWSGTHLLASSQNILTQPGGTVNWESVEKPVFWINGQFKKKFQVVKESISEDIIDDINDISLDLTDGRFSVGVRWMPLKEKWSIFVGLKDHTDYDGFLFSEVEDFIIRTKEYLGVKYFGWDALKVGDKIRTAPRYIEDDDRLSNIAIYYKL